LAWGVVFDRRNDRVVVCVFSSFNAGGSVCVCVRVYARTDTHCTDGVIGIEPRSQVETPRGPEESRWTKSWHTYIRVCVQNTHVYVHASLNY